MRVNETTVHQPVLLEEITEFFEFPAEGEFHLLDATFGGGGHSAALLDRYPNLRITAIDRDKNAVDRGQALVEKFAGRLTLLQLEFADVTQLNIKFDGVLADLGLSSDQLAEGRGFSFKDAEDLDMRMNNTDEGQQTAKELLNTASEQQLVKVFKQGGVRRQYRQLALEIIRIRPIETAKQLAELLNLVMIRKPGKKSNPATVVFQAIRIAVNQELQQIKQLLKVLPAVSNAGAKIAVISFHSLEDQIVAKTMRRWSRSDSAPVLWQGKAKGLPRWERHNTQAVMSLGNLLTKKAVVAGEEELAQNPRARSALLRTFEFFK